MRRILAPSLLSLAVLLLPLAPAQGQAPEGPEADLELVVREMERLLLDLSGARDVRPVFKKHGSGLYSLSVKLSDGAAVAKPVRVLANGHMLGEPDDLATLINAVIISPDLVFAFWWAVVNTTDEDLELRTTNRLAKGPGLHFKRVDHVLYPASTIQLSFFFGPGVLGEVGQYFHKTKATSAGSARYYFWAL